jgi:hypothetical protein
MKKIQTLIFLLPLYCFAQDKITVSKVANGIFIETYNYYSLNESYMIQDAYRLGPTSIKILKDAINTSIKWSKLNKEHQKEFEKEIVRFKVMNKERYKFHGYVDSFTQEFTIIFKGYDSGLFEIIIKEYDGFNDFIRIDNTTQLLNFQNLLNGKSVNKEIDEIFSN